jgi:hypothetical protein
MALFYDLDCSDARFVELAEGNDWEGVVCPKNSGHQRAGRRTTVLHINVVSKRVVDFSTTILPFVVITDKALQVLRRERLTGFRVEPVRIHGLPKGMDLHSAPKLWEFIVTGDAGLSHPESGITVKDKCEACGMVRYSAYDRGIKVNVDTYDGSDFFVVKEYPGHVLVNEKAKNVIEVHGLSGVTFVESMQLEWPNGIVKP